MPDDDETDGAKHSRTSSSSSSSSSGVVLSIAHLPTTDEDEVSVLRSQFDKCRKSLSEKDDEIHRLSGIRDKVEAELEDLTASLFEEAHRMVAEANVKRASAEKSVKEAKMQIEGLTAEVAALKAMVITSTPAQPNKHLHPQIDSQASPSFLAQSSEEDIDTMFNIDPIARKDFLEWIKKPSLDRSAHNFISKLYSEDIEPALRFTHAEQLGTTVFHAIVDNTLTISPIARDEVVSKKCALIQAPRLCRYRITLGSVDHDISQLSRNRIISVCDCWNYLRYVTQGMVKSHSNDIYWKIMRLRIKIFMARLGFKPD